MTLVPQVEDASEWVKHFTDMADQKMSYSKFFVLGGQGGAGNVVKLVSPSTQMVEMAKSRMDNPNVIKRQTTSKKKKTPKRKTEPKKKKSDRKTRTKSKPSSRKDIFS